MHGGQIQEDSNFALAQLQDPQISISKDFS
jgi:hypothetical protein